MPGAVPTAIHVPLGVAIFAGSVALSATMGRHLGTTPDVEQQPGRHRHDATASR
jgi:hypothetical protein